MGGVLKGIYAKRHTGGYEVNLCPMQWIAVLWSKFAFYAADWRPMNKFAFYATDWRPMK